MDYQVHHATTHLRPVQVIHADDALTTIKVDPVGCIHLEHYDGTDTSECDLTADEAEQIGRALCTLAAYAELRIPRQREIIASQTAEVRLSIENGKIQFMHGYTTGDDLPAPGESISNHPDIIIAHWPPTAAIHIGQQLAAAAAQLRYLYTLLENDPMC